MTTDGFFSITSYTTTCPVTYEATYGGKTYTQVSTTLSVAYSTITSTVCPRCSTSTESATTKSVSYSQGASQTISHSPKIVFPIPEQTTIVRGGSPSSAAENTGIKGTGSTPLASPNDQSSYAALNGSGSVSTQGARPDQQASHLQSSPYPALASVTGSADYGSEGTPPPAGNSEIQGNGLASVEVTENGSLGAESQPPAPAAEGHGKPSMPAASSRGLTTQMTGIVTKVLTATIVPVPALPTSSSAMGNSDIQRNGPASVGLAESGSLGVETQPTAPAAEGYGMPSIPAASSQPLTTEMTGIVTKVSTATVVPVVASPTFSSAMNDLSRASSAARPLVTETLIPVPVSPSQYIRGPGSAPYPSGNATSTHATLASEGLSSISASAKTGSSAVSSVQPTSVSFTGAASKQACGILAVIGVAIGAAFIV